MKRQINFYALSPEEKEELLDEVLPIDVIKTITPETRLFFQQAVQNQKTYDQFFEELKFYKHQALSQYHPQIQYWFNQREKGGRFNPETWIIRQNPFSAGGQQIQNALTFDDIFAQENQQQLQESADVDQPLNYLQGLEDDQQSQQIIEEEQQQIDDFSDAQFIQAVQQPVNVDNTGLAYELSTDQRIVTSDMNWNEIRQARDQWFNSFTQQNNYYSRPGLQGQYAFPLNINSVGPLFENVFLPGTAGDQIDRGPTLQYLQNAEQNNPHDPRFRIPRLEQINDINEITRLSRGGNVVVMRTRMIPFPRQSELTYPEQIRQVSARITRQLNALNQLQELQEYQLLRIFLNISVTGFTALNAPVQMNFQTFKNIPPTLNNAKVVQLISTYITAQLVLALYMDYYYEPIENIQWNSITFYSLFRLSPTDDQYLTPEQRSHQIILQGRAFNQKGDKDTFWKYLDATRFFKELNGLPCLLKIAVYLHNYYQQQGEQKLLPFGFRKKFPNLSEAATEGKLAIVFNQLTVCLKDKIFLYFHERNYWFLNRKPHNKQPKAWVIVFRKAHVILTQWQNLQKAFQEGQDSFKLKMKKQKPIQIVKYVFDIETFTDHSNKNRQIPYLVCVIRESLKKKDKFDFNDKLSKLWKETYPEEESQTHFSFWGVNCVKDFLKFVDSVDALQHKESVKKEFWSFNGSKFDNLLIVSEMLKRSNDVHIMGSNTQIKVLVYKTITFYDMILMYQGSLQNVATQLQCKTRFKTGLDVANKSKAWYENEDLEDSDPLRKNKIIEYCFNDCQILLEIVEKHYCYKAEMGLANVQAGTNSSLAFKIYQNKYNKKEYKLEGAKSLEQYQRERESYHGGYTQNVGRGELRQQLFYYDINSSYPNVMQHQMPGEYIGESIYMNEPLVNFFMYEIEGEWEHEVLLPLYCEPKTQDPQIDQTLLYFKRFTKQYRWGIELIYMVQNKLFKALKITRQFAYKEVTPFKEFVQDLYQKRIVYREQGKPDLSQAVKLSLNSLYGKMGQRQFPETVWCFKENLGDLVDREDLCTLDEVDSENEIYRLQFEQDNSTLNFLGAMVRFASYITASARMNLFIMFHKLGFQNILYCDTDSLISTVRMPEQYIDSAKLGLWKLEHELSAVTIWGPKFYRIFTSDEKQYQHIKGVKPSNYKEETWTKLRELREVSIVNEAVFTKKFGQVFVNSQNKKIRLRDPNRVFWKVSNTWSVSHPFYDLKTFKQYKNI